MQRRDPVKRDPKMVKVGRGKYVCANEGCDKELNEVVVKNLDPFCSTDCCHAWHGVSIVKPDKANGIFAGSSS